MVLFGMQSWQRFSKLWKSKVAMIISVKNAVHAVKFGIMWRKIKCTKGTQEINKMSQSTRFRWRSEKLKEERRGKNK
jgi:hypothetical protein